MKFFDLYFAIFRVPNCMHIEVPEVLLSENNWPIPKNMMLFVVKKKKILTLTAVLTKFPIFQDTASVSLNILHLLSTIDLGTFLVVTPI